MRRGGSRATVRELEDQLRRLSINDATCLESLLRSSGSCEGVPNLDPRSVALVRIAALVAMDGPAPAFEHATSSAMAAGASAEDVVGVLTASAPIVRIDWFDNPGTRPMRRSSHAVPTTSTRTSARPVSTCRTLAAPTGLAPSCAIAGAVLSAIAAEATSVLRSSLTC